MRRDQERGNLSEESLSRMNVRRTRILLLLAVVAAGCSRSPHAAARSPVVVISVDTLRADHLPVYGYRGVRTPAIDAIARDSSVFENAYSNVPLTLPSHASLLTGLLPFENGVRDNIGFRLAPAHRTLATLLRSSSYATGAAVSSYVLRADRGLTAGFDYYDDSMPDNPTRERAGMETAAALAKWAESVRDRPLFLFLHIYEPHAPYTPPEPFASRYASVPYDGEIAAADAAIGSFVAFLKRAGLYDRAILVFLSDHGEGLGDHGEEEHGVFLYREAVRVPLLLKRPGSAGAGQRISTPVSLTDVVPTVLSLLSIPLPSDLHGLPLTSPSGGGAASNRRIYSETLYPRLGLGWSDLASLADARYHYIHAPRPELYDLAADPGERNDLSPALPAPFRSMRAALEAMSRPFSMPEVSSPEELKKLAALGYISVSPGAPAGGPLPDPKDKVEALRQMKRLFELYYASRYAEAVPTARDLVAGEPQVLSAWNMLSDSLDHEGKLAQAIEALRSGIARVREGTSSGEQLAQAYDKLSLLCRRAGDAAGGERTLREAVARGLASEPMRRDLARLYVGSGRNARAVALLRAGPPLAEAESLETLGVALAGAGKGPEAKDALLAALAIEPASARIAFNLGTLLLDTGDAAGARDWFVKSLQSDSGSAPAWAQLGFAQARLGDTEGAEQSWRKSIELDPRQYGSLYNLAVSELRAGRTEDAREKLERFLAAAPRAAYAEQRAQAQILLRGLKKSSSTAR
jgi:choline-sulfatase